MFFSSLILRVLEVRGRNVSTWSNRRCLRRQSGLEPTFSSTVIIMVLITGLFPFLLSVLNEVHGLNLEDPQHF